MNAKMIIGGVVILVFIVFAASSFLESNVEYTNIAGAMAKGKKVQMMGTWNKERESGFDASTGKFSFYLIDDAGKECRVFLDGAAPNNFEVASSIVAQGRYNKEGYFEATKILTKCPSKYEAKTIEPGKPQS